MDEGEIAAIARAASRYCGPNDRGLVDQWKVNVPRFPTVRYDALARCRESEAGRRIDAHRRLKSALLATARRLIAEGGCAALTIRALADIHAVSRPTIYNIVGQRADILRAAIDEPLAANTTIALRCAEVADLNPIVAMADTIWFSIAVDEDYARQMTFAVHALRRDLGLSVAYAPIEANVGAGLRALARRQAMQPALIARTTHAITRQIVAALTEWAEQPGDLDRLYLDMVWAMILPMLGAVDPGEREALLAWLAACEAGVRPH